MIVSSLSRAAAGFRALSILYILFSCFCFLDIAVASRHVPRTPQPRPQPQPLPLPLRSPLPSRPHAQLQRAVTGRQEDGDKETPVTDTASTSLSGAPSPTPPPPPPFTVPTPIFVNQPATIGVRWPTQHTVSVVVLCQTNATDISHMTADNTWVVLSVDFSSECTRELVWRHLYL